MVSQWSYYSALESERVELLKLRETLMTRAGAMQSVNQCSRLLVGPLGQKSSELMGVRSQNEDYQETMNETPNISVATERLGAAEVVDLLFGLYLEDVASDKRLGSDFCFLCSCL